MRELLLDRLTALLGRQNAATSFVALPVGLLTGDVGILATLALRGYSVAPIA